MLGYHVSKMRRSLPDAVRVEIEAMRAAGITTPCCQVFFSGPQSYKTTITLDEAAELRNYTVFVHGAYVDYMNGSKTSIDNIRRELVLCDAAEAAGLILHLGANMKPKASLAAAMDGTTTPIYLEINAQRPPNWADKHALYDLFSDLSTEEFYDRLGLCIDTQHLYACGVALRTAADFTNYIDELRGAFTDGGLELPPIMFHLNDSDGRRDLFATGVDRHEEVLTGSIWSNYNGANFAQSGCAALLNFCKEHNLPAILESKDAAATLTRLKQVRALPY